MIVTKNNFKYEFNMPKILFTNEPFDLIKNIYSNNSRVILINPLTRINELLEIKTGSPFLNYLTPFLDESLVNENLVNKLEDSILNDLGDIVSVSSNDSKILKTLIEVKDDYVNENFIKKYLNTMTKFLEGCTIIFQGFESHYRNFIDSSHGYLNIFQITSNLSKINLTREYLEEIVLFTDNEVLEIINFEVLKNFLETKTNISLSDSQIIDYFLNKNIEFSSFAIEKALKTI